MLAGAVEGDRPHRKHSWKTWVTLGGVAASIFAIGLLASFAVESAAGHPLSGGDSGTSVGSLFGQTTGEATSTSEAPTTDDSGSSDTSTTRTTERTGGNQEQTGSNSSRTSAPTTSRQPNGGGVLSSLVPQ
jgi:cytoskeletal protein RodZ